MESDGVKKAEVSQEMFEALTLALEQRGRLEFTVATGSMRPLIEVGAKIAVEPLGEDPSRFEILVFWDGVKLICHYLWSVNQLSDPGEEPTFITRNLLNGGEDLPVSRDRILGRVTNFRIPFLTRMGIIWRELRR